MSANVKKRLRLEYLGKDKPDEPGVEAAGADALDIISEGSHLYGSVLIPDGSYEALRPCVILIHGFPGTARNDDLAQALRRIGCVVLTPHHRGAWGSEGKYLISNCVEDMVHIAEWVRSPEICEKWKIDPDSIFLCGHSMGGNTALQSGRRLQWVKGIILMTPYDPSYYLLHGQGERFRGLIEEGSVLHSDGLEAIYKDADAHKEAYCFADAFEDVKDRNMCIVVGSGDDIAPGKHMIMPLWNRLKEHDTVAVQKQITFDCDHCMCNVRMALAEYIAQFMKEVLGE